MSTYVMTDIHGCYEDMMKMLNKIEFTDFDTLILAGDYIDRGPNSFEMLKLIANPPDNMIMLCGNHDLEFAYNVELMESFAKNQDVDMSSCEDTRLIYTLIQQLSIQKGNGVSAFDYYGTIAELIEVNQVDLAQLIEWAKIIRDLSFFFITEVCGRKYIIVHAGYTETLNGKDMDGSYDTMEAFYIYARDDAYISGGVEHGTVIAGHTPTILEEELPYNNGEVYKMYDEELDCTFYDIDCGCSYRERHLAAKLACIRLEDEAVFYV